MSVERTHSTVQVNSSNMLWLDFNSICSNFHGKKVYSMNEARRNLLCEFLVGIFHFNWWYQIGIQLDAFWNCLDWNCLAFWNCLEIDSIKKQSQSNSKFSNWKFLTFHLFGHFEMDLVTFNWPHQTKEFLFCNQLLQPVCNISFTVSWMKSLFGTFLI